MKDPDIVDLFEVIEPDASVKRCVGEDNTPVDFYVFSPKVLMVRQSVPFKDKTIEIITDEAPKGTEYTERRHFITADSEFKEIVADILRSVLANWRLVYSAYTELKQDKKLYGRRFELWRPFLAVCKVYAPNRYEGLLKLAYEDVERTEKGDVTSDVEDFLLAYILSQAKSGEETLSKLQYRHVRQDLEANRVPIHVYVEADITKGKYHDYDTFLGAEAAQYLKLYLELRRQGSPDGRNPPEVLTDESPLIRSETSRTPKPIGAKQIRKVVHQLYKKAGLLKPPRGRMYDLRVHSLRKYFKTQMLALGVQPDYVDYMMGHTVSTYHDIQMKGVDFLRNIYANSGLSIKPKTKISKIDALKEIIRAWGMNPEQILTREALTQNAAVHYSPEDLENHQLTVLSQTLRQLIRQEAVQIRSVGGGPEGN